MLYLKSVTFNPFQENTYLLFTDEGETVIIDPGNSNSGENKVLQDFIREKKLEPTQFWLTHGHIDHILGNRFVFDTYGLKPLIHTDDLIFLERAKESADMYGVNWDSAPMPEKFLSGEAELNLGKYKFRCIHAPGHSPGSLCFYNIENKLLIAGDVLFDGSIGRSDLPGGDYETLLNSIRDH